MKNLYEREKDETQINDATEIYNKIIDNISSAKRVGNYNIYDFTDIVGFELLIAAINNNGKGHGLGKLAIPNV